MARTGKSLRVPMDEDQFGALLEILASDLDDAYQRQHVARLACSWWHSHQEDREWRKEDES